MSEATDRLAASNAALAAKIDEAVTKLTSPAPENTDAAVNAVADAIDAETAKLDAALNPPA